jgi:hypothetical protein
MKRWSEFLEFLVLVIVFALLSGCATISRQAGFQVRERESLGPQEPWHNLVLRENVSEVNAMTVAYVPLPQPVLDRWLDEFKHTRNGQLLQRWVFRALLYRSESFTGVFDAVLNKQRTGFFVLLPKDIYAGNNLVILSSDALWLMTIKGELVDLPQGQSLMELPVGFFHKHPSQMTQIVEMRRSDPAGKKFLADLEEMFPRRLMAHGKMYSGRGDAKYVADNFTAGDNSLDNIISCGALSANMAMITPVGAAITMGYTTIRNTYVAINGCQ